MSRPPTDIQGTAERLVFVPGLAGGTLRLFPALHAKAASRLRGQSGLSLIEIVVALGISGLITSAFLLALNTTYRANQIVDEKVQAEALARTQLDTVLGMTYNTNSGCFPTTCYPVTGTLPGQYNVVITTQPKDTPTCIADGNCNTMQIVTASVSRPTGGGASRAILSVSVYKGKR